jgi:hypothetical protein
MDRKFSILIMTMLTLLSINWNLGYLLDLDCITLAMVGVPITTGSLVTTKRAEFYLNVLTAGTRSY